MGFKTSPGLIRLAVMLYIRFPLSLGHVEDRLHQRDVEIRHETVRFRWNGFGRMFAAEIQGRRVEAMRFGLARKMWRAPTEEAGAICSAAKMCSTAADLSVFQTSEKADRKSCPAPQDIIKPPSIFTVWPVI
jgi:putative transposase